MTVPFFDPERLRDPERIRRERGRAGYEFSLAREMERIRRQHREGKLRGMERLLADPEKDLVLFEEGVRNMARERLRQRSQTFKAIDRALYPHSPREALDVLRSMRGTSPEARARRQQTPGRILPEIAAGIGPVGVGQAARDVISDVRAGDIGWGTALAAASVVTAGAVGVARKLMSLRRARAGRLGPVELPTPRAVDRPELDTPTFERRFTPEMRRAAGAARERHRTGGGSTVDPRTGEAVEGSGFIVSPYKNRERVQLRAPTETDFRVFYAKNRDLLDDPTNMAGTWFDEESKRHILDIVKRVDNKDEALRIGREAGQDAIFDLGSMSEVRVPGTAIVRRPQNLPVRRPQNLPARREPPRTGAVLPPSQLKPGTVTASGLTREDAVARMRQLNAAKVNAQMQRQPDGTFNVVIKGQPGQRVGAPPEERTLFGPRGEALGSGFQSRLLTVLREDQKLPEKATVKEWYSRLKNHPGVSRAELDAVFEHADLTTDPDRIVHRDWVGDFVENESPVTQLRRTVFSAEGGERLTSDVINQEAEYLWDQEVGSLQEQIADQLGERDRQLQAVRSQLEVVFGPEGGRRAWTYVTEPLTDERPYAEMDFTELAQFDRNDRSGLDEAARRLRTLMDDPQQLALPDMRAAQFAPRQQRTAFEHLSRAEYWLDEAVGNAETIDAGPDWDDFRTRAAENLQETGEYGFDPGDTQYSRYQRVNPAAPYREILVENPALSQYSRPAGHFRAVTDDPVQAWARGEIDDDTFLMIEAQSDVAQGVRRRPADFPHLKSNPFLPTERSVQLSTGAALRQAAEEGLERFAWVTPENRRAAANLAREAGNITYGQAVPKAVERIFRWLDEPLRLPESGFPRTEIGGEFLPYVPLTPSMRQKIMRAGVPILSAAPGVLGAGLLARERLRQDRRGLLSY